MQSTSVDITVWHQSGVSPPSVLQQVPPLPLNPSPTHTVLPTCWCSTTHPGRLHQISVCSQCLKPLPIWTFQGDLFRTAPACSGPIASQMGRSDQAHCDSSIMSAGAVLLQADTESDITKHCPNVRECQGMHILPLSMSASPCFVSLLNSAAHAYKQCWHWWRGMRNLPCSVLEQNAYLDYSLQLARNFKRQMKLKLLPKRNQQYLFSHLISFLLFSKVCPGYF